MPQLPRATAMARRGALAYIPHNIVKGPHIMSSKALQTVAFLLLIALTLYVAFGGGM